jgi:glutathione peroxidase
MRSSPSESASDVVRRRRTRDSSTAVKKLFPLAVTALVGLACSAEKTSAPPPTSAAAPKSTAPLHQFEEKDIDGKPVKLDRYAGKVLLIVNVASKCGYTPQYEGLEKLYEKHQAEGLEVLGFPCDQFGNQEPGTENEIKSFCMTRYSVKFPLFSKVEVNGPNANPLYSYLRKEQPGAFSKESNEKLYAHLEKTKPEVLGDDSIKWNFTKFLVDRNGKVLKRFESGDTPEKIEPEVVAVLAQK